jgi:predicted permease
MLRRIVARQPSARFIVGDLREEYAALYRRRGGLLARFWYAAEVARLALRWRGGEPGLPLKRSGNLSRPWIVESGGPSVLGSLAHEVRDGARSLRRRPGLSVTAGVILALAIGVTTAIFSVVDGVLLEPLPFPDPDRVVRLGWEWPSGGSGGALTPLKFEFWEQNSGSFDALATYRTRSVEIGIADGEGRTVRALAVSRGFLQVIGSPPVLGRDFTTQEDRPGGPRVAILGDALWRELFAADPGAVGRTVHIGDIAHTVVGVLSADLRVPTLDDHTGLLVPLQMEPAPDERGHNFEVVGRLRPGLDIDSAGRLEAAVAARFAETYPDRAGEGEGIRLLEFLSPYHLTPNVRHLLWVLLAAVGAVLLIACANVAGLMLVKTAGRRRELAARAALGASRGCIIRQLLVESILLAGVAAAAGTLVAWGALDILLVMVPVEIPRLDDVGLDPRVLAATVAMALGVGTLTGVAAAIPTTREDPASALREGGRGASEGRGGARLRKALVAVQIALSVTMLSAAGALLVTFVRLTGADLGFEIDGLYSIRLDPVPGGIGPVDAIRAFESAAVGVVGDLAGVQSAASTATAPLERGWNIPVTITAGDEPTGMTVEIRVVGPGYFRTLGTPLLRGRPLADTDRAGTAPVAVINQALAERLPAGGEVLGGRVAIGYLAEAGGWLAPEFEGPAHEIVGVAGDVREYGALSAARPTVYVLIEQAGDRFLGSPTGSQIPRILVRTDSTVALGTVRERLLELEPRLRAVDILPMTGARADSLARERFNAVLMGIFGVMALVLTLVGLYGMLADAVGRRVQEIGIRMALGARPGSMLRLVLAQAMVAVGAGLVFGLAGAVAAGNLLQSMVHEISPTDPRLLGGVAAMFLVVALLAGALPALRATRVDPVETLRADG